MGPEEETDRLLAFVVVRVGPWLFVRVDTGYVSVVENGTRKILEHQEGPCLLI